MQNQGLEQIKRRMVIHNGARVLLMALLLLAAWRFQLLYAQMEALNVFFNSILLTIGCEILFFYPIYRFASNEVKGELAAQALKNPQKIKVFQQKKRFGHFIKGSIFIFYLSFILMVPTVTFVVSTACFSFIATALTYLQSYNFTAKKLLAPPER